MARAKWKKGISLGDQQYLAMNLHIGGLEYLSQFYLNLIQC